MPDKIIKILFLSASENPKVVKAETVSWKHFSSSIPTIRVSDAKNSYSLASPSNEILKISKKYNIGFLSENGMIINYPSPNA